MEQPWDVPFHQQLQGEEKGARQQNKEQNLHHESENIGKSEVNRKRKGIDDQ
jgi:hypothetical protein